MTLGVPQAREHLTDLAWVHCYFWFLLMICLTLPCVLLFNCLLMTQSVQNKSYSCDDVSNLQEDLDRPHSWSVKWSLFFNDSKCVSMSFFSSKPSINSSYHIAGNSIEQLNFHRIILQENLKGIITTTQNISKGLPETWFN